MQEFEINFDILFIGAGIASISAAYYLKKLINQYNQENQNKLNNITIGVFEKSKAIGDHILSGAVLEPKILDEFIPAWESSNIPIKIKVSQDNIYFLNSKGQIPFPIIPRGMNNHGNYIISLSELVKWLSNECEKMGIEIYTSEPIKELIYSKEGKVIGVKTGEKSLDKENKKKVNFSPGAEIGIKILVAGEGSYGFITKKLINKFNLNQNCNPQNYVTGIKELWEIKGEFFSSGLVLHTFGYPLDFKTFGGGFVYHLKDNLTALGLAIGLNYENPKLNLQEELQKFKTHPLINKILSKAKLIEYGAKTISEGGYYTTGKLSGEGFILIGEGAGLLNSQKLKGIHLAIKSGMLAAETIFEALKLNNFSLNQLSKYDQKIKESWIFKELHLVRNFHQGFQKGLIPGMIHTGLQMFSGGRGLINKFKIQEDYRHLKKISEYSSKNKEFIPDGKITFDRLTEIYFSGVKHEEDQPCHLKIKDLNICRELCFKEYGNPCTLFCPARVYEFEDKEGLIINPSNCLHCKTCEIKDPYNIIEWTPPEGGGGPNYKNM